MNEEAAHFLELFMSFFVSIVTVFPNHFFSYLAYETSCFSGIYVTGEDIDDPYFSKLHDLRNDTAKELRRKESGATVFLLPPGSNDGCENLSNDKRGRG